MRIVDKQIKHMRKLFHSYLCFIIRLEPCWIKLAGLTDACESDKAESGKRVYIRAA